MPDRSLSVARGPAGPDPAGHWRGAGARAARTAIVVALAVGSGAVLAQPGAPGPPAPALPTHELTAVNRALAAELRQALQQHLRDAVVEVSLVAADEVAVDHHAGAIDAPFSRLDRPGAGQRLFLLSDAVLPGAADRSVLRAYEAIVGAANCGSDDADGPPGCKLLLQARDRLRTPKLISQATWPDGPAWRPVAASPAGWAAPRTPWLPLTVHAGGSTLRAEMLFVKLDRPWLLEDFLGQASWYVQGQCAGAVSDGDPANDASGLELLPRIPIALLLTRQLVISDAAGRRFTLGTAHVVGRAFRAVPRSPREADPSQRDCPRTADQAALSRPPA